MKSISLSVALLVMFAGPPLTAQGNREQQLRSILELQDRRSVADGSLRNYFSDRDARVRSAAVLACGSIQDTTLLPALIDVLMNDQAESVQKDAAFAIGQTAGFLSAAGKERLQDTLTGYVLGRTKAQGRLIEEMGKFITKGGLEGLVKRFGPDRRADIRASLTMCVARCGIRSVNTPGATAWIVSRLKSGDCAWQDAYAAQRIGNVPELAAESSAVGSLSKRKDPLIRLNCAVLLGKLKQEGGAIRILTNLGSGDRDWQVRVAALKALALLHPARHPEALRLFRGALTDEDAPVALTAAAQAGDMNPGDSTKEGKELTDALRAAGENKQGSFPWQVQAEAAISLAKISGEEALPLLTPPAGSSRFLTARLLSAAGSTGAAGAAPLLFKYADDTDRVIARTALEGLEELALKRKADSVLVRSVRNRCIASLASPDVALVTTAAGAFGDSLFQGPGAVQPLVDALGVRRLPEDVEAIQAIIQALGALKDSGAVHALEAQLNARDRSVRTLAAQALERITGVPRVAAQQLPGDQMYTDFDFDYLAALPETVKVTMETDRGTMRIDLYKNAAPFTVMSFLKLALRKHFYDGLVFHRVVPTFVIQGGDPRGDGWGGAGYAIRSEFSPLRYERGTLGIASAGKDTEGSQFFITQSPQPHLDGRYTIFGKVTSGMDAADKVLQGDRIRSVKLSGSHR